MDKNAIKRYAVWARRELISRVSQRAAQYEITADGYGDQNAASVHGRILSADEKKQRTALIAQIKEKGYEQVMEEIAYTWFNRFSALRFMEVNGYLPTRVRVFTDDENNFKPQILTEAINMELDGLDMQKVYDLKNANDDDALFKYMIIVQCNALSKILPGMFQRISDYTELLFPDNLLREGSVVEQMITMIPQEDWTDQVQIIGWLYQYYIAEPKDELINARKKYKDADIPFVTQLFTSSWIVKYMVENSLGRLWLVGHPNEDLKASWKYYLDEADQAPSIQTKLANMQKEYSTLKPEDILAIDPCQGSGHILSYMFDVLVQIYEAYGYSAREAAASIVEHNIWGLDIDERAAQLAYFSVMMKARQYDRRFFSRGIQPHVYVIQESNKLDPHCIEYFVDSRKELKTAIDILVKELYDAREYGSILSVTQVDFDALYSRFEEIQNESVPNLYSYQALEVLLPFVRVAQVMAQKYHVVVTNPPYLNSAYMPDKLKEYVSLNYTDVKNDMFSVFMYRAQDMCRTNGHIGLLMPYLWMFITSYERMRFWVNKTLDITSLVQLEYNAFEAACVPVAALTLRKSSIHSSGEYIKLSEFRGSENQGPKTLEAVNNRNCGYRFTASQESFSKIPGSPIAFWVSDAFIDAFAKGEKIKDLIDAAASGHKTADNDKYIRLWFEVEKGNKRWVPLAKGGEYRRWYGNWNHYLDWSDSAKSFYSSNKTSNLMKPELCFKAGITWSDISTRAFSCRYLIPEATCETVGPSLLISDENDRLYLLGLLNSKYAAFLFELFNPGLHYKFADVYRIPVVRNESYDQIITLVKENVLLAKEDWDSFESSWDFQKNPLIKQRVPRLKDAFTAWEEECRTRFEKIKQNEESLNSLFNSIYGIGDEMSPFVDSADVNICHADLEREIKGLISYAVGCMFGRFSLDDDYLVYAGGKWDETIYKTVAVDKDNILPICDDEYFEDDIVGRFIDFVREAFGDEFLAENLQFIASVLGGKGTPKAVIRNYFISDYYRDHCNLYAVNGSGKRPIYWLFDSGKKNGFKCLIYMHRYQPDTIARIRTDYVHEQQSRYRTAIADLENRISNAGTSERVKLAKKLESIRGQAEELRIYEEKVHHLADQMIKIDLDDGVKHNYAIFQDILAKVK